MKPGADLSLTVDAYRGSYVGILAVDQSVLLLKGGNDITQSMVRDTVFQFSVCLIVNFVIFLEYIMQVFSGCSEESEHSKL